MYDDGTGKFYLVDDLVEIEWGDGKLTIPESDEAEAEVMTYTFANEYLVLIEDDVVMTFTK